MLYIEQWQIRKGGIEMSHLSMLPIAKLRDIFDLKAMIETGTEAGYGVETGLKAGFNNVCSCEIWDKRYEQSKERFKDDDRVHLFKGPSGEQLKKMLKFVGDVPVLFWLDAHLPNRHDRSREYSLEIILPLPDELEIIYSSKIRSYIHDVILMDDLCLINNKYRDNNLQMKEWTDGKGSRDVAIDWMQIYFEAHDWYIDQRQEGVLIGLPNHYECKQLIEEYKWSKV